MSAAFPDTATDRLKRAELLQAGLDLIDQGFTLIDGELQLVAWNRAFVQLLEFPDAMAYAGAPFESFIRYNALRGDYGPGDPEAQVRERVATARRFAAHDIERIRPCGQTLRIRGVPVPDIGFITLYSDVTQHKAAEQQIREHNTDLERRVSERTAELRRSEQQMRLITDSIPALVAYVDHDRHYRYINRGYRDWFGLEADALEQVSAKRFLGEKTYDSIKSYVTRAFAGEPVGFEYDITRIDGSCIRARTSLIPDRTIDGQVAGCFELTFDISEQLRAQELVLRAQKMDALGQLTGGLAHDFNNLLTVIIGNLGRLADRSRNVVETDEYVVPALQAARRGADMIKRLMRFARQQPLQAVAVDAAQAVADVSRLVRRSLPESMQIELTGVAKPAWTWIDPAELETALLNLLLNARDATAGNGRVVLHVQEATLSAEGAGILAIAPGRYVRIDVKDNGCGMDAATQARMFEPFFTTKPVGSGTGLGLAMVYGFVKQSGGAIEVSSMADQGTTISLWLPQAEAPGRSASEAADDTIELARPHGLALLVEDDASVRQVVRRFLLDLGYSVLEAENGVEARDILSGASGIELLLTDVVMPGGVDGRDLAREARDVFGVPRVLLMSGHAPTRDDPNDVAVLAKPFSPAQLAAALRKMGT